MKIHFFRKKVLYPALFVFGVATMFDLSVKKAETGYAVETDFEIDDNGELTGYHGKEDEVTVPEGVKAIGEYAFSDCESLKKIILPDSVKEVKKAAFSGCSNLAEIVFSDNVETIEKYAFSQCSSLAEIVIPEKVTKIPRNTFFKCSSLKKIKLPKGLKSIGRAAFLGCGLKEITIPKNVKKIKVNAFKKSSIEKVSVKSGNKTYRSIDGVVFEKKSSGLCLAVYPAGKKDAEYKVPKGVVSVGKFVFYKNKYLEEITFPKSLSLVGCESFSECDMLKKIHFSKGKGLKKIEEKAFYGCDSLEEIVIPEDVELQKNSFSFCESLKKVILPDTMETIGNSVFSGCDSLTKVHLPKKLKKIGFGVFTYCDSLSEIKFPDSLETIGGCAFEYCGLKKVKVPEKVTKIGEYAFYNDSLRRITVDPDNRNYESRSGVLFQKTGGTLCLLCYPACKKDAVYQVPEKTTQIEKRAFLNNKNLESVVIPGKEIQIGEEAFSFCIRLKSAAITGEVKEIGNNAFKGCDNFEKFPVLKNMETVYCRYGKFFGCEEADELKIRLTAGKKLKIKSDRHMKKSLKIKSKNKKIVSVDERTITAEKKGKADVILSWYSRHGKYREKILHIWIK